MSTLLWRYYYEDDFHNFERLLESAAAGGRAQNAGKQRNISGQSRGDIAFSPGTPKEFKKTAVPEVALTRADINRKDAKGMTLLHYAASQTDGNGIQYALALIAHPLLDLFIQDLENGWTALHRAFYFGNITIARAILEREAQDAVAPGSMSQGLSLIKIKDREGNGPYDLLTETIKDRTLHHVIERRQDATTRELEEEEEENSDDNEDRPQRKALVKPTFDAEGDELYTFGSNKNINLGLGNQDDRHYPERVNLKRPAHLYKRFYREMVNERASEARPANPLYADKLISSLRQGLPDPAELPATIRFSQESIQDVQMAKFHTAVITNDPVSNLYMTGHGFGGRLGTGSEKTEFSFVCVEDFGGQRKKIISVALGQDHSLAVTDQGEIFSWGSNAVGQLGLGMPKSTKPEESIEVTPKQIFGPLKREIIIGVAASRIHSVAHTSDGLYTFGKNEGQLGIMDAHARSLELQSVPRRIAASRFSSPIRSVSAIDRATICLLENDEVHVFANYGVVKVQFPLDFVNSFLKQSFLTTRYDETPNKIVKVTSGGDTICALSSAGEVFSITVGQSSDSGSSTTNPNKIKAALSTPSRIWSLKKGHMNAKDVGVDHDGAIILSTEAGSVWRRTPRVTPPGQRQGKKGQEFKFSRIPGLTRAIAVRASSSGAYCAIRQDCDVTKEQIVPQEATLWSDMAALLPFKNLIVHENPNSEGALRFWKRPDPMRELVAVLAESKDLEKDIDDVLKMSPNEQCFNYDILISTTVSKVQIPAHQFVLGGRSQVMRQALNEYRNNGPYSCEMFTLTSGSEDKILLTFAGIDFLTLVELTLYLYTDRFVGFWNRARGQNTFRYREVVGKEIRRIAARLELRNLEAAARRVTDRAEISLDKDFELALLDADFLHHGDTIIDLADGDEARVHADLISRRVPFFDGLFHGRAGGRWLAERRDLLEDPEDAVSIDMQHVEAHVFQLVLRHIYTDAGEELFDDVVAKDLNEFLDLVLEVLSIANELMMDRLSQICQTVLGQYVNVRNACELLNAVGPSSVIDFKKAGLEYLCLNLEGMLSNHLLDELDEDLLLELDAVVRDNQLTSLPYVRSGRADALLLERHPELPSLLDRDRQQKLDSISLLSKHADGGTFLGTSFDLSVETDFPTSNGRSRRARASASGSTPTTPAMRAQVPGAELGSSLNDGFLSPDVLRAPALHTPGSASVPRPSSLEQLPSRPSTTARIPSGFLSAGLAVSPGTDTPPPMEFPKTRSTAQPWGAAPSPSVALGVKEILEQASASRPSGISLGFAAQQNSAHAAPSTPGPSVPRMSQKERRLASRQQSDLLASPSEGSSVPKSPWQMVSSKPKVSAPPSPALAPTRLPSTPVAATSTTRSNTTPQLTMRQTIANIPARPSPSASLTSPSVPRSNSKKPSTRASSHSKAPADITSSSPPIPAVSTPGFSISQSSIPIPPTSCLLYTSPSPRD